MATIIVYPNENSSDFELGFFDGTTVTSKNIFTGAGNSSSPQYFAHLGNKLIFEATDATGRELWITDGTAAGTHQVKDINPSGDAFSDGGIPITSLDQIHDETPAVLNGLAFFGASDGTGAGAHGREPWVTDGTNGPGTHMLMDIRPGTTGSGAHDFVAFGSFVYFIANDGTHDEVWKTDGTTTSKVTTLSGGATSGPEFGSLTVSGSNLFFVSTMAPQAPAEHFTSWTTRRPARIRCRSRRRSRMAARS
jgi:ELWxxDGT repeat protein